MIPRNPNGLSPRTLRDCTFQEWADPIERPGVGRWDWLPTACAAAIVICAVVLTAVKAGWV